MAKPKMAKIALKTCSKREDKLLTKHQKFSKLVNMA